MRSIFLLSLAVLATLAGCGTEPDDCLDPGAKNSPYIGEPMFNRCAGMELMVDRPAYTMGDTLTLTISFETLYTGVGSLAVCFLPLESRDGQVGVSVTAPSMETDTGIVFSGSANIDNTGRLSLPVSFVIQDNTPYHITATVRFLQVRNPVTGEMLDMHSDEQIEAFGPLDHTAYGTSTPLVVARPLVE